MEVESLNGMIESKKIIRYFLVQERLIRINSLNIFPDIVHSIKSIIFLRKIYILRLIVVSSMRT